MNSNTRNLAKFSTSIPFLVSLLCIYPLDSPRACTVGSAMGNGTADGRPFSWKNRDGSGRHKLTYIKSGGKYDYLAMTPNGEVKHGLNEAGFAIANALGDFSDSKYEYANNTALKNWVLTNCKSVAEARQAIKDVSNDKQNYWPKSTKMFPAFSDAHGMSSLFEIGAGKHFEYAPTNPVRMAQFPQKFVCRDNTSHQNADGTDDLNKGGRYGLAQKNMTACAASAGISMKEMFQVVSRHGHPGQDNGNCRLSTRGVMIAHGVNDGEDPRIATFWASCGNPDYCVYVPVWVAQTTNISKRVTSDDVLTSIPGCSEKLVGKNDNKQYDTYINNLVFHLEENILEAATLARDHWLKHGFNLDEATSLHMVAAEAAWQTLSAMSKGTGRNLNRTPTITSIKANVNGLAVTLGCTTSDKDGSIASYSWNMGDGNVSSKLSHVHSYDQPGTYLVSCKVTDDKGSANVKWRYVTAEKQCY